MPKKYPEKECEQCGDWFRVTRPWKRFCSTRCQFENYNERKDVAGRLRREREEKRSK